MSRISESMMVRGSAGLVAAPLAYALLFTLVPHSASAQTSVWSGVAEDVEPHAQGTSSNHFLVDLRPQAAGGQSSPSVGSSVLAGAIAGALTATITVLAGDAPPTSGTIAGSAGGALSGLLVAADARSGSVSTGSGAAQGAIPGLLLGAIGGALSFSNDTAIGLWALIYGIPGAVAGLGRLSLLTAVAAATR